MPKNIQPSAAPTGPVLLTAAQLRERYGHVSHMFVERLMKRDPNFPRPVTFAGSAFRFWVLAELEAYERSFVKRAG